MYRDDSVRLQYMLDAAREAIGFVLGRTRSDLDSNRMLVLALVKAVEILGEAAGQVSPTTKEQSASIPWTDIAGMRNRLVHAYFDINLEILWQTVQQDLPPLVAALEKALAGSR